MKCLIVLIMLFSLVSCLEPEIEDDFSSDLSCTFKGEFRINLSADITADFNETNVPVKITVTETNCPNIYAGDVETSSYDRVSRSGNGITFSDDGASATYTATGTTMPDIYTEISGRYTYSYTGGKLETSSNDIVYTVVGTDKYGMTSSYTDSRSESLDLQNTFNFHSILK